MSITRRLSRRCISLIYRTTLSVSSCRRLAQRDVSEGNGAHKTLRRLEKDLSRSILRVGRVPTDNKNRQETFPFPNGITTFRYAISRKNLRYGNLYVKSEKE